MSDVIEIANDGMLSFEFPEEIEVVEAGYLPAGVGVGPKGDRGYSAYEIAVQGGFVGTQTGWLASLKGPAGTPGTPGAPGAPGPAGADGAPGPQGLPGIQGPAGTAGPKGDTGSPGEQGPQGFTGADGVDGVDGATAYELAVAHGFVGTETEWLASLVGPQRPKGDPGDPGSGGGGGVIVRKKNAYITSGSLNPIPGTGRGIWTTLAGFEIAITAQAGDWVSIRPSFMWKPIGDTYLDIGVMVGSSVVRYLSSGNSVAALEGDPALYPVSGFKTHGYDKGFFVTPGDLDNGTIRFVLSCSGAATGILYAEADYPFYWEVESITGAVPG
ncbi:collagen-like protein [Sphaerisporangium sp. NPDC005288]|uniref:collagen-like triple helix repeat-containing protein n=1 Tax=Sphaerisporangium sp. NPDC005288 TaxID=3155114 RepID=UPI0033AD4A16